MNAAKRRIVRANQIGEVQITVQEIRKRILTLRRQLRKLSADFTYDGRLTEGSLVAKSARNFNESECKNLIKQLEGMK